MNDSARSGDRGPTVRFARGGTGLLALFVLVGAAVSVALGVYSRRHVPTGRSISTFGFPTLLSMKAWLATAAAVFAVAQVASALRMYGRIGHGPCPAWVAPAHRISGVVAVVLTLPVAFHCLWSLGFGDYNTRVLVHSVMGCAFYGVFVTQDAGGPKQQVARLGAPGARGAPVHDAGRHLADVVAVVLPGWHSFLLSVEAARQAPAGRVRRTG